MGYRVEVFDKNLKRVGEVDEWISLDFTVRLSQEGYWQMLIKDGTPQSKLIEKGGGVAICQDGVDKPVLSGQVETFQKYWTKLQHTGPGSLYIAGQCHNTLAYRRLAFPDPARSVDKQYQAGRPWRHVTSTTGMERVFHRELDRALGPGALPNRRVAGVNLGPEPEAIPLAWPRLAEQLRMDVIGSKLEEWFAAKGVAYRFIYNPQTQEVDLEIFRPRDRSKDVRFSPDLGNLREYIWTLRAPKVTRAIVGCAGEGFDRYYYQKIDEFSESEWGVQIEQFIDRRDIQLKVDRTTGEPIKADPEMTGLEVTQAKEAVEDAADSALAEGVMSGNFQIYPIDTEDCKFGRDYFVGDHVTVDIDGTEYVDVVREVTVNIDDAGNVQDVSPKIGQQGSGEPLNLYKTVYDMQRKLRRLESRM